MSSSKQMYERHGVITRTESQSTGKSKLLPLHSYPSRLNPRQAQGTKYITGPDTAIVTRPPRSVACIQIIAHVLFSNCRPQALFFSEQPVTSSANSKALSPVHSPVHGMVQSRVQVCSYPCSYIVHLASPHPCYHGLTSPPGLFCGQRILYKNLAMQQPCNKAGCW